MNDIRASRLAAEILKLPEEERSAAVAAIKCNVVRSTVKFYLKDRKDRIAGLVEWVLGAKTLELRRMRIKSTPENMRSEVMRQVADQFKPRRRS